MFVFIARTLKHPKISEQQLPSKKGITNSFPGNHLSNFGSQAWKVIGAATRLLCYRHPNTSESMLLCPKIIYTYTKNRLSVGKTRAPPKSYHVKSKETPLVFFHTLRPPTKNRQVPRWSPKPREHIRNWPWLWPKAVEIHGPTFALHPYRWPWVERSGSGRCWELVKKTKGLSTKLVVIRLVVFLFPCNK